jgi:hypothetical protein
VDVSFVVRVVFHGGRRVVGGVGGVVRLQGRQGEVVRRKQVGLVGCRGKQGVTMVRSGLVDTI